MREVVSRHLDDLRWRNYSPGTIYQRERCLTRLETFGVQNVLQASHADLRRFLDRRQADGRRLATSSQVAELAHLRAFYKWCVRNDIVPVDPTLKIDTPKMGRRLPHPLPEHDLARALAEAPDRIRPMLYLGAYAGLRACEVAPLRGEELWWKHDPPSIFVARGKGGDEGLVPIAPILEPVLRQLPNRGWLFPRMDDQPGHIQPWGVSGLCNRYLHRIGIDLTFHSLRHRFGTKVLRASGGDLRATQELMRHRSITSTVLYTEVEKSQAAGIVAALPG